MPREPLLSIAVACYNVEDYLSKAIASYTDDRLSNKIEVILVDDGSTDGTCQLIDGACANRPDIFRCIHKQNGGHGSAVNAAINAARGRYFRIIDGDDWVDTEELIRFVSLLADLSCDVLVDERVEINESSGSLRVLSLPASTKFGEAMQVNNVFHDLQFAPYMTMHTITVALDLLRREGIQLLENTFYVDIEFILKSILAAHDLVFLDTRVYQYRMGTASQSVADDGYVRHFDDHTRVTKEILSLLDASPHDLGQGKVSFLYERCKLLVETHYNICLIFDKDRKRGKERAKSFHAWLRDSYPEIARRTERRYLLASVLHSFGVDSQDKLDKLTGRLSE